MYFPHAATTIVTTILNSPTQTDKCILGTTGANNNNNNKSKATSWPTNFKTAPDHTHRCSQAKEKQNKTKQT